MSSGFGPRSRSRLVGSDRPDSACTVNWVSSGVLSSPLPSEYCALNERPLAKRLVAPIVIDLKVESPIDCTSWIWLNRGSRRVAALAVVLKIGRPSANAPIGLIGLMLVTTRSWLPVAYITERFAVRSRPIARSSCAFACQVCATSNEGSMAHGDCTASVPVDAPPGKAGAPAEVPLKLYTGERGEPLNWSACS